MNFSLGRKGDSYLTVTTGLFYQPIAWGLIPRLSLRSPIRGLSPHSGLRKTSRGLEPRRSSNKIYRIRMFPFGMNRIPSETSGVLTDYPHPHGSYPAQGANTASRGCIPPPRPGTNPTLYRPALHTKARRPIQP